MPTLSVSNVMSTCDAAGHMTTRVLLTGSDGFAGAHVVSALRSHFGKKIEIIATSKVGGVHPVFGKMDALDVTDTTSVRTSIAQIGPTHVIHLAAIAAVGAASSDPETAWAINLDGTRNLAQAVLEHAPGCWLLNVGSGLIYG